MTVYSFDYDPTPTRKVDIPEAPVGWRGAVSIGWNSNGVLEVYVSPDDTGRTAIFWVDSGDHCSNLAGPDDPWGDVRLDTDEEREDLEEYGERLYAALAPGAETVADLALREVMDDLIAARVPAHTAVEPVAGQIDREKGWEF